MVRSLPASTQPAVAEEPYLNPVLASVVPQSVITRPAKPHSSRRISVSSSLLLAEWMPFTRL